MGTSLTILQGRGAGSNPAGRFERLKVEDDFEHLDSSGGDGAARAGPRTEYLVDHTRSIIATNDSPDVGFDASVNPYRGCEHGCIYCFARPTHEYLDLSAGLDFETKILVKLDAPALLRKELSARSWEPRPLGFSGVTDPYQPVDRKLGLTRRCLEVIAEFRNPVVMVTKGAGITRDVDLLVDLARRDAARVCVSVTTLDNALAAKMEPRAAAPQARLEAMRALADGGVPVGVLVAPIVPGLNDHEIAGILSEAAKAGASFAGYVPLRLPFGLKELFEEWLAAHFPDRREKVLNRVRDLRGGKLNDPDFFTRMRGEGPFAAYLKGMFDLACRKTGLKERGEGLRPLSAAGFRREGAGSLFD